MELDGIILMHGTIHSLKTFKKLVMLIKFNMSKDFNKLSWRYIYWIFLAFGFSPKWTNLVLSLTSYIFFSILVNGYLFATFYLSHNIRQGDPLSHFIFILMVESIGRALKVAIVDGHLKGIKLTYENMVSSNLYFVEDIMLMGTPMVRGENIIQYILLYFMEAYGISLNHSKNVPF